MEKEHISLDDFIEQSLTQIVKGVTDAQEKLRDVGARINPPTWNPSKNYQVENVIGRLNEEGKGQPYVFPVDFDVAISVSNNESGKGGLGVFIGNVGLGAQKEGGSSANSVSRLKFTVPISFPEN